MSATTIIGFSWGDIYIYDERGTAVVNRTNGHMNKDEVVEALSANGYRIASAGRVVPAPHMKARAYDIKAA